MNLDRLVAALLKMPAGARTRALAEHRRMVRRREHRGVRPAAPRAPARPFLGVEVAFRTV